MPTQTGPAGNRRRAGIALALGLLVIVVGTVGWQLSRSDPPVSGETVQLTLVTEMTECNSIGGCAGYVRLIPFGVAVPPATRLSQLGGRQVTQGLPAFVERGLYTVVFKQVAVSDEWVFRTDGPGSEGGAAQPAQEWTTSECRMPLDLRHSELGVTIEVTFAGSRCDISWATAHT